MESYRPQVVHFVKTAKSFFCWDTETTGLDPVVNDIIEFSAIEFVKDDKGTLHVGRQMDIFINPGYSIPKNITDLTGITNDDIKDAPSTEEAAEIIRKFLGDNPNMLGYNSVSFDEKFLDSLYKKAGMRGFTPALHLDVMKMAKEKLPSPHRLGEVVKKLQIGEKFTFHRSIDDVKATAAVFRALFALYVQNKEADIQFKNSDAVTVTGINYWSKGELERLYISTNLPKDELNPFYDIKDELFKQTGDYNPKDFAAKVFNYSGMNSMGDVVASYKEG